jgi:predicted RNase H-like nuclease (RuvC/YqgF family)
MSGYSNTQEFLQAVEQAEQQRQVEQEASRMGIDPNTYQQYFQPVNQRLQSYEQELQHLRMQETTRQIESQVAQLERKYPDFSKYANDAFNMAITRGYDLEHAYRLASYEDKMNNLSKQTEQQVLAQVTGRSGKQVLPSTDKPNDTKFDPSSMSLNDIEAISKRVARGERITF